VVEEGTREGDVAGSNPTSHEACEKQFFADFFFDSVS
jgi:hypothetical protein